MIKFLLLCCAAVALGGCAFVTITDASGTTFTERHLGFVYVRLPDVPVAVVAETSVFGIGVDPLTTTVGFGHSRLVTMPGSCGLLIFAEDAGAVNAWRELLPAVDIRCIVQSKRETSHENH